MNGKTASAMERCVAYVSAAGICIMALHEDGIQAITLSIGVAATLAGIGTWVATKKES